MPYSTDKNKVYNTRVLVNSKKSTAESVNLRSDYKFFAGVSYAALVKPNCNKKMSKNNLKISDNINRKSGTVNSVKSHKVDNAVMTKHSSVVEPSKGNKSKCHLKYLLSRGLVQNTATHNKFNVLQNLNENNELDEDNMDYNTSVCVNVNHVNRNIETTV